MPGAAMIILELVAGIAALAVASWIFWYIGNEHALSPRMRNSIVVECTVVLVVLGGWTGGISAIADAAVRMFS